MKLVLKQVPPEDGLTHTEIIDLASSVDSEMMFPVVFDDGQSYCLGFMDNDLYTEYLENKNEADRQIRAITLGEVPQEETGLYTFTEPLPESMRVPFLLL